MEKWQNGGKMDEMAKIAKKNDQKITKMADVAKKWQK